MYQVITDRKKIQRLQQQFEEQFAKVATQKVKPILGYQGGSFQAEVWYTPKQGIWLHSMVGWDGKGKKNRYWNGFGTEEPEAGKNCASPQNSSQWLSW
jgi:hypothetical protein